jgi:hypothetical protein
MRICCSAKGGIALIVKRTVGDLEMSYELFPFVLVSSFEHNLAAMRRISRSGKRKRKRRQRE